MTPSAVAVPVGKSADTGCSRAPRRDAGPLRGSPRTSSPLAPRPTGTVGEMPLNAASAQPLSLDTTLPGGRKSRDGIVEREGRRVAVTAPIFVLALRAEGSVGSR